MQFVTHASGSAGNLYTLTNAMGALSIELGVPFRKVREALKFQTSRLDGALVSHEHGDHARGVKDAIKAGVDVYMSRGTAEALGVSGHRVHILQAKRSVRIGTFRVYPFEAVHDAVEPLNFVVSSSIDGGRLLYVTDSAYCPYRFTGLTVVAIEANYSLEALRRGVESGAFPLAHKNRVLATHMSIDRAVTLLQKNDLSRCEEIVLLHLSDGNSDEERFVETVRRATGLPVRVAPGRTTA